VKRDVVRNRKEEHLSRNVTGAKIPRGKTQGRPAMQDTTNVKREYRIGETADIEKREEP